MYIAFRLDPLDPRQTLQPQRIQVSVSVIITIHYTYTVLYTISTVAARAESMRMQGYAGMMSSSSRGAAGDRHLRLTVTVMMP